jgi:hypothetical protein
MANMRFTEYRYLFPPRPETAAAPTTLSLYETQGWWVQAKMNGTCCTLYVPPDRNSFAMGRHGPENRLGWQPGARWKALQARLPGEGWYVLVGELLHSKGVGVRDTVYLFDLLVDDGEYLIGAPYRDRHQRLARLCELTGPHQFEPLYTVITPGVWLAVNHEHDFPSWFTAIRNVPGRPPIEGLVLKLPDAKLLPCGLASANSKWQAKCRVATNNLSF